MEAGSSQYLTYQHNVQRYFQNHMHRYNGIIVPLSIIVSFGSGTYGFIRALCSKDKTKQYAIDPRTPLFQKEWNRTNARPPHEKMAEVLGGPIANQGLRDPLTPEMFDDAAIKTVTKNCLDFQLAFRSRSEDKKKLQKYSKLLGIDLLTELQEPQFLIPPYFQFDAPEDPWIDVCLKSIGKSFDYAQGLDVRPVLHMKSWSSLNDDVLERFLGLGAKTIFLYPNQFKEHDAKQSELRDYRSSIEASVKSGVTPYAMFGGYFAILMHYFGLAGFGNGVGYGEWRDSGYHKGGTPAIRLYVPRLHRFLDPPIAQTILDKASEYFSADSVLLKECVKKRRPLIDISQEEALDHFMECRSAEISYVARQPLNDAIKALNETIDVLKSMGRVEYTAYGDSLSRWHSALSS